MVFGETLVAEAEGTILAHTLKGAGWVLKKGRKLTQEDCARLLQSDVETVLSARLEEGDVHEDAAARQVAEALTGTRVILTNAFTGRCNVNADCAGVVRIDGDVIDRLNAIHESVTVATLADYDRAAKGQVIATVKIIPFAVEAAVMETVSRELESLGAAVSLVPFTTIRAVLINTVLPTLKDTVKTKTTQLTRRRVEDVGGKVEQVIECPHTSAGVADAMMAASGHDPDLIIVVGASVTMDRADAAPAGIVQAGGTLVHFGMPVDPGNMMLLAKQGGANVVVLPGCARSPKLNGIDWLLERFAARIEVTSKDVMALGVGGLLIDSPARPLPRDEAVKVKESPETGPRIAAVVLAGGQSRRMGAINKLLEPIDNVPLVRRTVETVLASRVAQVVVVTGHESDSVQSAVSDLDVTVIHNPDFADGLSTSMKAGLGAVQEECAGALICLADMPAIQVNHIDALVEQFEPGEERVIGVPVYQGKRGNPVLWGRRFFDAMTDVSGDVGARHLIGDYADLVYEVEFDDTAVLTDLDTPEQWSRFRGTSAS